MPTTHDSRIYWMITCNVQPGQLTDFKQIVEQLVAAAKSEPGTLAYEFSINADQSAINIFESYQDSSAVLSHVSQTFAPFAERFLALARISQFVIYGNPNNEVKKAFADFNPTYMTQFDGFTR